MAFDPSDYDGFDWDSGNITKNVSKHNVTCREAEKSFSTKHSSSLLTRTTPKPSPSSESWAAPTPIASSTLTLLSAPPNYGSFPPAP